MDPKAEIIKSNKKIIDSILDEWGFTKHTSLRDKKRGQVIAWLNNFIPSEIEDAILLLSKVQYKDSHLISEAIKKLAEEIKNIFNNKLDNVKFFPLGKSPSSSGGMYLYEFRKDLGLSEDNFPYSSFKENLNQSDALVFFDDIIGSGNQAIRFAKNNFQNLEIDIYYFSIFAYAEGLENVRNSNYFNYNNVICEHILSDEERAFNDNSFVFKNSEIRGRLKSICEKYGRTLYPKHPLGYDDSQSLLVFPHNTPNNTLPIFWASENNEKATGVRWNPIWERQKIITRKVDNTIAKYSNVEKVNNEIIINQFNSEAQSLDSNKLEIGSKEGILRFKELYEFAYNSSSLNMTSLQARDWALAKLNDFTTEDIAKFKELYDFAYNSISLNMTSVQARDWAFANLNKFTSEDIAKFNELYKFAYDSGGLNMASVQAKDWALNQIDVNKNSK